MSTYINPTDRYQFNLQQRASEAYLEGVDLGKPDQIVLALVQGNNREIGQTDGFLRFTQSEAETFVEAGNDTYIIDNISDLISETSTVATEIDLVQSSVSYTLSSNLENLILIGSTAINGFGNSLNNVLTGNADSNRLDGGIGNDTMIGGLGNDTYVVDNIDDVVIETSTLATELDAVESSISYTLGTNVESLVLIGTNTINGTGNALVNWIGGNAAANILDGGLGADTLVGGAGNDTYIVDNIGDIVIETDASTITGGTDLVKVSIANSGGTYTLSSNLENATLTNTVAYRLTGNAQNNVLTGNNAENTIKGYEGNDTLNGGLGRDFLIGGQGNDLFTFSSALSETNIDKISDFLRGTDRIVLDATIFTKLLNDTNLTDNIVVRSYGTNALDANDYLIFNSYTKALYYDADGSGFSYKPIQFATLIDVATVSASDFVVI